MTHKIRWGILGPGAISRKFVVDLRNADGAEVTAVGSRSRDRALQFAADFDIPRAHDSYDALASDPDVDAIYIGTPHTFHKEHTILCLLHGKHVLCEKPFAINVGEAAEMVRVARAQKCALMEAMLTRHLPAMVKVRELIADGTIGDVQTIMAGFGFRAKFDPMSRLFDPNLGGGALLDLGIYPLSCAFMLLGEPDTVDAQAHIGKTGVDEESNVLLEYEGRATATLAAAICKDIPREAFIMGTKGFIKIFPRWWVPSRLSVELANGDEQIIDLPFRGGGYIHEAEAFMDVIRSGKLESDVMPLDESLSIVRTMDAIRAQWGLKYPME